MKSNAPWSVKGIERDARETAKEAAKREGMTVGEWLNQMIYAAGNPESSGGEVEGLQLRDIVTAIDHLNQRIADSADVSNNAVSETTRKLGDVVERVQRLERNRGEGGGDRERVDALKALEKAVSQVAVQFSNSQKVMLERLDAQEDQVQKLAARYDESGGEEAIGVGRLKDAIDGLQLRLGRIERNAAAASRDSGGHDSAFVENTGNRLRVLGDEIKRGGDQIRALESTIGKLAQQIEAAERRSAEGVQKTAETLSDLREKFASGHFDGPNREDIAAVVAEQTRDSEARIDRLQASFETMITRLESLNTAGAEAKPVEQPDETLEAPSALEQEEAQLAHEPADDLDELLALQPAVTDMPEEIAELDSDADVEDADSDVVSAFNDEEVDNEGEDDQEIAATSHTDDEDDDDDFFSFADDIDASIEESPASDEVDEFSFELDEDASDARSEGEALLAEVKEAYEGDPSQAAETDPDDPFAEESLDELLGGIDAISEEASPLDAAPEEEDNDEHASQPEDYLKEIRRKAREQAEKREQEEAASRKTRRSLTPKQRAILAARARKKRMAAEAGEAHEPITEEKRAAAKRALAAETEAKPAPAQSDLDEEDEEQEGIAAKISGLASRLPFLSRKKKDEAEPLDSGEGETDALEGDQAALETLKSTASARPVTLGIAIALCLLAGLLFFVVKDRLFSSDSPRPAAIAETSAATEPVSSSSAEPALEAPEPPAVDPRTLYRDAMTALSTAQTDGETAFGLKKLQEAALLGLPPAQLQLGEFYRTGQAVDQDLTQSRSWFRRAANGGNVLAMHRLGIMLARGDGGPADTGEALSWFERAANHGLVDSQYNLGALYQENVEDFGKAYFWYSVAAKNGDDASASQATQIGDLLDTQQKTDIDSDVADWTATPPDTDANAVIAGE